MSGGSLGYVHEDVRQAAEAHSTDISDRHYELVRDIAGLLKTVEYASAGDYGEDQLEEELEEFAFTWRQGAMAPTKRLEVALLLVESALDDREELGPNEKVAAGECLASLTLALEDPETQLADAITGALP